MCVFNKSHFMKVSTFKGLAWSFKYWINKPISVSTSTKRANLLIELMMLKSDPRNYKRSASKLIIGRNDKWTCGGCLLRKGTFVYLKRVCVVYVIVSKLVFVYLNLEAYSCSILHLESIAPLDTGFGLSTINFLPKYSDKMGNKKKA